MLSLNRYYDLCFKLKKFLPKVKIGYVKTSGTTGRSKYYDVCVDSLLPLFIGFKYTLKLIEDISGVCIRKMLFLTSSRSSTALFQGITGKLLDLDILRVMNGNSNLIISRRFSKYDLIFSSTLTFDPLIKLLEKGIIQSEIIVLTSMPPLDYYKKRLLGYYSKDSIFWSYMTSEAGIIGIAPLKLAEASMYIFIPFTAFFFIKNSNEFLMIPSKTSVEGEIYVYPLLSSIGKIISLDDIVKYIPDKTEYGLIKYIDRVTHLIKLCFDRDKCIIGRYDSKWKEYNILNLSYSKKEILGVNYILIKSKSGNRALILERNVRLSSVAYDVNILVCKKFIESVRKYSRKPINYIVLNDDDYNYIMGYIERICK